MPDYNYSIEVNTNNGNQKLLNLVCVDTVLMCGQSGYDWMREDAYPMRLRTRRERARARRHFEWIESKLKKSAEQNYSYTIVVGHFPVWAVAEHGPTKCLVNQLRPLLHKYNVTAYLAGRLP